MNKWKLYQMLRQHETLKEERHPMFEKNRFMKFLMWFMVLYYAAILLLLGVTLPLGMSGAYNGVAAFHVLDGFFLIGLMLDFWMRFMLQETPAQTVKPYRLLPISRKFLMHIFLIRRGLTTGNLFWGFFLVPFGLIAVKPLLGWWSLLGWWLGWWLLCVANSYAYMFIRALCIKRLAWILIPLIAHIALLLLMFVPQQNVLDIPCTEFMYQFALGKPWAFLVTGILIAIGYTTNFILLNQMHYDDVAKKEEVVRASQMKFLNRYGAMGEYMKLEIKLRLRNKQVRNLFFVQLSLMILLSSLLYFTDIYDNVFMKSFILLYDFVGLGLSNLIMIMCYEGNYIDGLMSRRESIYSLLQAKYYFNIATTSLPLLIIIPIIFIGKFTLWMVLGYFLFSIGVLIPLVFQLAIYNNNTIPLNQKINGKQGNAMQQVISIALLVLPIAIEQLCVLGMGPQWGYMPMIVLGIAGIILHPWWIRHTYQRFMLRRYTNMEGFRASRKF